MGGFRAVWRHEERQAGEIALRLIAPNRSASGWKRRLSLPFWAARLLQWRRLANLRKNLLFTKELAFEAAKKVVQGGDKAREISAIDQKTRDILSREKKGLYTDKVRRKQLQEIELLIEHYLRLLEAGGANYREMIERAYRSEEGYERFLDELRKREKAVMQGEPEGAPQVVRQA